MLTDQWAKSTRSNPSGNCVETRWKASSYSGDGHACTEVRSVDDQETIQVRDSKDPDGPVLSFTVPEGEAFIGGVKDGEFDLAEKEPV
jgi:hypothetical protein